LSLKAGKEKVRRSGEAGDEVAKQQQQALNLRARNKWRISHLFILRTEA
jgi:hypothetical protein